MSTIRSMLWLLACAALAACASATPYQPKVDGTGYTDQKLESNRWRVTFTGNHLTPRQTVENYLLYRAAELTLSNGFDYFVLTDRSTEVDTTHRYSVSAHGGFGPYYWYPWHAGIGVARPTRTDREYQAEAIVLMFKGEQRDGDRAAFDARELKSNLEPVVSRPAEKR